VACNSSAKVSAEWRSATWLPDAFTRALAGKASAMREPSMGANRGVAGVQQAGCRALANLAHNNAGNQTRIAAAGGIEAVVVAMGAHRGVAGVQKQGCGALCRLGTGLGASREVQQRIKRANAEEAVKRAMAGADATAFTKEMGRRLLDTLVNV
jgi:hypothetical protein